MTRDDRPQETLRGQCPDCGHVWVIAYLPMQVQDVARRAKRAECPHGCKARPVLYMPPVAASPAPDPATNSGCCERGGV